MTTLWQQLRIRFSNLFARRLRTAKLVVGVVIHKDGKYLLLEEQREGKTVLNIPAGHVDPTETPIEAARREAKEESGLDVKLTGIRIGMCNTWKAGWHTLYWIFDGEPQSGEVRAEPSSKAMWLTLDEWQTKMQTMETMPAIPHVFEAVKSGSTVSLDTVYFIDRREGRSREIL